MMDQQTDNNTPLKESLQGAEVLSLDVFDTCVFRRTGYPFHVFRLMECETGKSPRFARIASACKGFSTSRLQAEWHAAGELREKTGKDQVRLEEVYEKFREMTGIGPEDAEDLMRFELESEQKVILPNPEILELAQEAQRLGIRIVYITDMYLERGFIIDILRPCGFPVDEEDVFVSGEHRVGKLAGGLYDIAQQKIGVPFSKWVHVGDNCESDIKNARKRGIKALQYPKLVDTITQKDLEGRGREKLHSLPVQSDQSLAMGIRNAAIYQNSLKNKSSDFWYRLGFEQAGILVLGFVNWLVDQCIQDRNEMMVFMSRDGHLLKHCFELICEWRGLSIKTVYLQGSRKAVIFPSLSSLDEEELRMLTFTGAKTVAQFLRRCDLDPMEHQQEIIDSGFSGPNDDARNPNFFNKLKTLFNKLCFVILKNSAEQFKLASVYMDDIGIPAGGKIGVVDVGWYGHPYEGFERLMRLSDRKVDATGYFLGTCKGARCRMERGLKMKSYLMNLSEPREVQHVVENAIPLIEFLFLAPHGTCLGFEETEDGVRPILEDCDEGELENIEKAMKVQEGILDFFETVRPLMTDFPHIELDPTGAFYPYSRTIMTPTAEEADMIGDLTHAGGFGSSAHERIADPKLPVEHSMWITGVLVRKKR